MYEGPIIASKKEGYGTYSYRNKDSYKGEFQNDLKHGSGTLDFFSGKLHYEGEFFNDKKTGKGVMTFPEEGCRVEAIWD